MCPPVVAAGALAISAVGTGLQVAGQMSQAKAARQEANLQANLASQEAHQEFLDSRLELYKQGIGSRHTIGAQEAQAAAANLDLTFGSAAGLLRDRYKFAAMESIVIGNNAMRRSVALRNAAAALRARGANAYRGGTLATAGVGLAGVGNAIQSGYSGYQIAGGS